MSKRVSAQEPFESTGTENIGIAEREMKEG